MSVYDYTSPSVAEFRARQARTRLYYTACESSVASFHRKGSGLRGGEHLLRKGACSLWLGGWWGRAPFEEGAPLWGRTRPFGERGAPLWERACSFWLGGWMRARPFWKKGSSKVSHWTLTYWFSIQYPDGVVQVVSTRGVAVSIAGCRLITGSPRSAFIGNPSGRPVQNAPFLLWNSWTFWCRFLHS